MEYNEIMEYIDHHYFRYYSDENKRYVYGKFKLDKLDEFIIEVLWQIRKFDMEYCYSICNCRSCKKPPVESQFTDNLYDFLASSRDIAIIYLAGASKRDNFYVNRILSKHNVKEKLYKKAEENVKILNKSFEKLR